MRKQEKRRKKFEFKMFCLRLFGLVTFIIVGKCYGETYQQHIQQNLGTAFEFKIHMDPGKEDCYWQWIEPGASFYASFHVRLLFLYCFSMNIYANFGLFL